MARPGPGPAGHAADRSANRGENHLIAPGDGELAALQKEAEKLDAALLAGGKQSIDTTLPTGEDQSDERQIENFENEGGPPAGETGDASRRAIRPPGGSGERPAEIRLEGPDRAEVARNLQQHVQTIVAGTTVELHDDGKGYTLHFSRRLSRQVHVLRGEAFLEKLGADPEADDESTVGGYGGTPQRTVRGKIESFRVPTKAEWELVSDEARAKYRDWFDRTFRTAAFTDRDTGEIFLDADHVEGGELAHEILHSLRKAGVLTEAEERAIDRFDEEAAAYAFEALPEKLPATPPGSPKLLAELHDIFRGMRDGSIARRPPTLGGRGRANRARSVQEPADAERIEKTQRVIVGAGHLARGADTFKAWSGLMREKFPGITDKQLAFDWREVRRVAQMDRQTRAEWTRPCSRAFAFERTNNHFGFWISDFGLKTHHLASSDPKSAIQNPKCDGPGPCWRVRPFIRAGVNSPRPVP